MEYSICKLEKRLVTARDIAYVRASCLGITAFSEEESFHKISGGLSAILVGVLSNAFQSWCIFYQHVTIARHDSSSQQKSTATVNYVISKSVEIQKLQHALTLVGRVSHLDTILGEEISRAGSQTILNRLLEQIKVCISIVESNGSCEADLDSLMDLQDVACETCFPITRGSMAFTDEELISRLPLVYNLRPAASMSAGVLDSTTVLIHQVTKRQTAQADVGYLMWPSAFVLARWLLTKFHVLKGKKILEIGAGCGLVGIVASVLVKEDRIPDQVIITDVNNTVLDNIARNINLNDVGSCASSAKLDFYQQVGKKHSGSWLSGEFNNDCARDRQPVDVILAADIICQPEDAVASAKTIYDALTPGGKAYVICANEKHRFGVGKFAGECELLNLSVTPTNVKDLYNGELITECMESTAGWISEMTLTFFEISKLMS